MKPGDLYRIEFWDHAEDSSSLIACEVIGRIHQASATRVLIDSWRGLGQDDNESNRKRWAILRAAITHTERLTGATEADNWKDRVRLRFS